MSALKSPTASKKEEGKEIALILPKPKEPEVKETLPLHDFGQNELSNKEDYGEFFRKQLNFMITTLTGLDVKKDPVLIQAKMFIKFPDVNQVIASWQKAQDIDASELKS